MKGKYITTQILLACLSRPEPPKVEPQKNRRFYWDHLDTRLLNGVPQTKKKEGGQELNTAA
jgi:hypothetical protein